MCFLSFWACFILFNIMTSCSIRAVTNDEISLLLWMIICHCAYVPHLIHPSIDGHSDSFHFLAVVNSTAVNMGLQMSSRHTVFISFGYICPVMGLLYHVVVLGLIFWGTSISFSMNLLIHIPIDSVQGFPVLHILPELVIFSLFNNIHFCWCEVISHCVFYSHFPDT